ncbi:MAG: methyltransferase domain-containing protein [Actinomycetota bacterium]
MSRRRFDWSSSTHWVLSKVPPASGVALDIGGGAGALGDDLEARGYVYVNLDLRPTGGRRRVRADAARIPLADESVDLVVSVDSLEHFPEPLVVLREVRRVLRAHGGLIVWVPFLHPFHGDDYYRYTPLGLKWLLASAGLSIRSFESPLWAFSGQAQGVLASLNRLGLGRLERLFERAAAWLDRTVKPLPRGESAFANAYLVLAAKES